MTGDFLHNSRHFRWRNWIIRGIFTWVMICGFGTVILMGPLYIVLLVCLQWDRSCGFLCVVVTSLANVNMSAWLLIVSYVLISSFHQDVVSRNFIPLFS